MAGRMRMTHYHESLGGSITTEVHNITLEEFWMIVDVAKAIKKRKR